MRKKILFMLLIILLFNCNKKENLDENFKQIIIEYQKKFPIPIINSNDYVYITYFNIIRKDTLFILSRSSNGLMPNTKGFGIFQDETLQPTFVYDKNNLSKKFVYSREVNKDAEKFYLNLKKGIKESYPPIYTYLIKKKEIKLVKIDTIWKEWD